MLHKTVDAMNPPNQITDLARVDISSLITQPLLNMIKNKNPNKRTKGLQQLQKNLSEAKYIKPNIGSLPEVLVKQVNKNTTNTCTTLDICKELAVALGPNCKEYVSVFLPMFLDCFKHSSITATKSKDCMDAWIEQCGVEEFFNGKMIMIAEAITKNAEAITMDAEAMKSVEISGPRAWRVKTWRTELWPWLGPKLAKLPPNSIPEKYILEFLPYLFKDIAGPTAYVREGAKKVVIGCMLHVDYDSMLTKLKNQKLDSKETVFAALKEARSKQLSLIVNGLKSKNARQRTESLDELRWLIKKCNFKNCQPSSQIVIEEIARHIADCDESVRIAALNCAVTAYGSVRDQLYGWMGSCPQETFLLLDHCIGQVYHSSSETSDKNVPEPSEVTEKVVKGK